MPKSNELLDNYLSAFFYSKDLLIKGASQEDHAKADTRLRKAENELFEVYDLDSEKSFDSFYLLVDDYRKDEGKYSEILGVLRERD